MKKMKKEKKVLWIAAVLFAVICAAVLVLCGSSYTLKADVRNGSADAAAYSVRIDQPHAVVRLREKRVENGNLCLTLQSVSRGRAYVEVRGPDGYSYLESVYVHPLGVITVNNYFGPASGAAVIPVLASLYVAMLLGYAILRFRKTMRRSLYLYRNIQKLSWILFFSLMLLGQIPYLLSGNSLLSALNTTLDSASAMAYFAFPIAFVLSVLVALSSIRLMRREGRNWRNMLGLMLGVLVCVGTILPDVLSTCLQQSTLVDVHNMRGKAMYVEMAVTNTILVIVSYLECVLWATIMLTLKAARRIPAFDKDYILILGCQIKKDGTLPPLLKGRADRALEFARMQKQATGKELIFVPCGGQGSNEIMPEGTAIRNYLVAEGVPDQQILVEDKSVNTDENIRNAMALIRERDGEREPKIAFATTNYHVFRSGVLTEHQSVHADGIGSKTRSYFWINAFVREFIAALYAGRKKHLRVIAVLVLLILTMVFTVYLSNVL